MQQGINIEDVKKYNSTLRDYKDKSTKLRAELEFSEQELARQCLELTQELGVQVTPENIESILAERIAKINNTMAVGNEILTRIKSEEASATIGMDAQPTATIGVAQTQVAQPTQVDIPTMQSGVPTAPDSIGFPDMSGGLPPIFANGQMKI